MANVTSEFLNLAANKTICTNAEIAKILETSLR